MYCVSLIKDLYIDIDECSDPQVHGCQHTCVNTIGSFYCDCDPGYTLDTNGKTCTGKLQLHIILQHTLLFFNI